MQLVMRGSKDGGREGFIIYDEVHRYENNDIVDVFSSGLGKVKHPREFLLVQMDSCVKVS